MQLRERAIRRGGFTIMELLVVILIILILMGLLTAAIQKIWAKIDEVRTGTEIDQMTQSAEAFRTSLGRQPPGRIRLIEIPTAAVYYDPANVFDMFSVQYLQAIFPGIYICVGVPGPGNPSHTHNWDGSLDAAGVPTPVPGDQFVLEGDECLVYFLGGIPVIDANGVIGPSGFCTDKTNPTLPTPGRNRIWFFEFKSDRLILTSRRPNNRFAVFVDRWNMPYLYFQARYGSANNYACFASTPVVGAQNDCPTATGFPAVNFNPYYKTATSAGATSFYVFHRPDSFQIVSAGPDQNFGVGGQFDPSNPEVTLVNRFDRDNFTNFYSGPLAPR